MPALNSTAITYAEYDAETETLTLTFVSGQSYDYEGVPEQVYLDLLRAPSAGAYYNAAIKDVYG